MGKKYKEILFETFGKVATLSLNRPEALNALTFDMMDEVQDALDFVEENSDIRALVFTASGKGFCSGQDLRNRPQGEGANMVEAVMGCYFRTFKSIMTCRVPVITAVNGVAAGGGFSLALTGDILIASENARFIQVFSRIGLIPDLGSTYLLPKMIGRAKALELMMTNEPLPAKEALALGMVNECVPDEKLMDRALERAAQLAEGPTMALRATRELVDRKDFAEFEKRFREELEVQSEIRTSYDAKEGVGAFLEKRKAEFRGY